MNCRIQGGSGFLSFEIGEQPGDGVLIRATANNQAVLGLHSAGCWYAINGKPDQAIEHADQLVGIGSVDAIILAVEVAQLAKRPDVAKRCFGSGCRGGKPANLVHRRARRPMKLPR